MGNKLSSYWSSTPDPPKIEEFKEELLNHFQKLCEAEQVLNKSTEEFISANNFKSPLSEDIKKLFAMYSHATFLEALVHNSVHNEEAKKFMMMLTKLLIYKHKVDDFDALFSEALNKQDFTMAQACSSSDVPILDRVATVAQHNTVLSDPVSVLHHPLDPTDNDQVED